MLLSGKSDFFIVKIFVKTPTTFHRAITLGASICLSIPTSILPPSAVLASPTVQVMNLNITQAEVIAAQNGWCDALLSISKTYANYGIGAATKTAEAVIDKAYAYQYGPVAFNPTLSSGVETFRATREGALAYFVGNNPSFPNDKGFALKPWRKCQVVNEVIQINGAQAITMGNVYITDSTGKVTTVDKTWSFIKEPDSTVRIVLHHSSLPFSN